MKAVSKPSDLDCIISRQLYIGRKEMDFVKGCENGRNRNAREMLACLPEPSQNEHWNIILTHVLHLGRQHNDGHPLRQVNIILVIFFTTHNGHNLVLMCLVMIVILKTISTHAQWTRFLKAVCRPQLI